jgi:hypothetical protein
MTGIDWDKLPEVLEPHLDVAALSSVQVKCAGCEYIYNPVGPDESEPDDEWAAHLAAVVRGWVEGQMTEEWGLQSCSGRYYPCGTERSARNSLIHGETLHRRLVTPWAPVEGDKP